MNWRLFSGPMVVELPTANHGTARIVVWSREDERLMLRALGAAYRVA